MHTAVETGYVDSGGDRVRTFAFFDVDGTIWSEKSVISFYQFFLDRQQPREARERWAQFKADVAALQATNTPREQQNVWFYENHFKGLEVALVADLAKRWYEQRAQRRGFFHEPVLQRIREHVARKHDVVLVTGSFREVVRPLAEFIGARHALVAPLEERDGIYTGRMVRPTTIGPGKALAVDSFMKANAVASEGCFGYGDDETDIPFLERLGHPTLVVAGSSSLSALARTRRWDTLDLENHGHAGDA